MLKVLRIGFQRAFKTPSKLLYTHPSFQTFHNSGSLQSLFTFPQNSHFRQPLKSNTRLMNQNRLSLRTFHPRGFSKKYTNRNKNWIHGKESDQQVRNMGLIHIGILSAIFGFCFLMVPLYKSFCQSVGLEGDLVQRDYSEVNTGRVNRDRKFKVRPSV